jgi:hypothetical protein
MYTHFFFLCVERFPIFAVMKQYATVKVVRILFKSLVLHVTDCC